MTEWSIYVLRCRDGSLYAGISVDVARRIEQHRDGARGARRLRGRGPLTLLQQCALGDRSAASRVEYRFKQLPKPHKERLVCDEDVFADWVRRCVREPHSGTTAVDQSDQDSQSCRVASSAGK